MAMTADPKTHAQHSLAGRGVYLLDDHEVVRRGLRHLLESDGLSIECRPGHSLETVPPPSPPVPVPEKTYLSHWLQNVISFLSRASREQGAAGSHASL